MDPVAAAAARGGGCHFAPPVAFHPFHGHYPGQHPAFQHFRERQLVGVGGGGMVAKRELVDESNAINSAGSDGGGAGVEQAGVGAGKQAGAEEQQPAVAVRRSRGRPAGSKNKPKPPVIITQDSASALRAHVLEVAAGCDVVDSVAAFSRRRQVGVCVLSCTGAVAKVSIRQTGAVVSLAGCFDILSLSGSFLPPPAPPFATGLTVYVSGGQGQVMGGTVAGALVASGPVVIMAASFGNASYERLPLGNEAQPQGLAGQSSPPPPPLPLPAHQEPSLAPDQLPHNQMDGIQLPGDAYGWASAVGGGGGGRVAPY